MASGINILTQAVLFLCASVALGAPARKPNIVIIVADDLGWKDVGYHGDRLSFLYFRLGDEIPDANTIWDLKEPNRKRRS